MKPIIGVVPSINEKTKHYYINIENTEAIILAGGCPLILPYTAYEDDIRQLVNKIDGLYITGGNDVDPEYFNEAPHEKLGEVNPIRDAFELKLLTCILPVNKPVLGVCKGMQMINTVLGGDLYQDITSQVKTKLIQHSQKSQMIYPSHAIHIKEETKLHLITSKTKMRVNSYHHQAVRRLGRNLIISGESDDGIIEAIESTAHPFVIGLQWHPECMVRGEDNSSKKIYESFIAACK